jgi:NAD(P)H dehydrogenase (quinone)
MDLKVGAVYFSSSDITENLVLSAISEVQDYQIDTYRYRIQGKDIVNGRFVNYDVLNYLKDCDAILFASPTYMGGVAAQFKAFVDATSELWCKQEWAGKVAAGITCGSALNGDQSSTLQYFVTFSSQHGMYWVGLDAAHGYKDHGVNRLGCQLGVVAQTTTDIADKADLATAKYLGRRVAELVIKLDK